AGGGPRAVAADPARSRALLCRGERDVSPHGEYANSVAEPRYCYRHPDRETGLSCSECGRPICVDCMTVAPVGIRCPEHAGARPRAVAAASRPASIAGKRVRRTAARHGYVIPEFSVTRALVLLNV